MASKHSPHIWLLCLFLVCLLIPLSFAGPSSETIKAVAADPAGLVAHYPFEGNAINASGSAPAGNGILVGDSAYQAGVFGQAIDLDGSSDYVNCGNGSLFNLTKQLTIAAWIKVNSFDKKHQTIISKGDNSWRLARAGDSDSIEFACNGTAATKWDGVGEVPWSITGSTSVNDGKWHHIAGVFDGSALYLYIDGILESAKAAANSVDVSNYEVCIGENAQVAGRQWNGLIDDVRIYNYALAQAEIVSLMGKSEITLPEPVPATLYNIAKRYDALNKCEDAKGLCELILKQYPGSSYAGNVEIYLSRRNISSLIDTKDYTKAQAELDKLTTDFVGHPDLAEAMYTIAERYELPGKYEEARSLYEQIVQLYPDSAYAAKARYDGPEIYIFSLIASGKYIEAQEAIDKFVPDFIDYPRLPGTLYWFAKRLDAAGQYEQARNIYQQVAWQYPDDAHATKALIEVSKVDALSLIEAGDDTAAQKLLDNLIADFADHPDLPEVILVVGEKYYQEGYAKEKQDYYEEARHYFRNAIAVFERIVQDLSYRSTYAEYAQHLLSDCYRRFGDKYCGAYAVWHTLYHYGLGKPIDIIVKEIGLDRKAAISIYEVVNTLKINGISAHAVKFDLQKINTIDNPFIQYIAPTHARQFGHFRLCIPAVSGKAVVLDGTEEPEVVELASFQETDSKETSWDGTSILIHGVAESSSLDVSLSELLDIEGLLKIAAYWLEPGPGHGDLPLDIQLFLLGGWHDDCKDIGKNCLTAPYCDCDNDCVIYWGDVACYDFTQEQNCKTPGSWPDCLYDPAHTCSPRRLVAGLCNLSEHYCRSTGLDMGDCTTGVSHEHEPKRSWMRQCHW